MSDLPHFSGLLRRAPGADRALLLMTFMLTVFVDLIVAVNVGVVIAALLFMRRMSETVQVEQQIPLDMTDWPAEIELPADALVYRIDGPFFFGAAEKLERTLERVQLGISTIVLRFGRVPFIDGTGLQTLTELIERYQRRQVRVIFCGVHPALEQALARAGVLELVGTANICQNLPDVASRLSSGKVQGRSAPAE
jgi:SulP family sulfate permease